MTDGVLVGGAACGTGCEISGRGKLREEVVDGWFSSG